MDRIGALPWSGPRATLPVHVTSGDRLVLEISPDGTPVEALLDSGSSISLLQTEAARRIGVGTISGDPAALVHGFDGGSISVRIHRFQFMSTGQDQITSPQIGIGESQLVSPEMILGLDYLRGWRIWIAYRARKIFMQLVLSQGASLRRIAEMMIHEEIGYNKQHQCNRKKGEPDCMGS
jgi:Aspartyl protease